MDWLLDFANWLNNSGAVNSLADWGDVMSWGIGRAIRSSDFGEKIGAKRVVDECSGSYSTDRGIGILNSIAFAIGGFAHAPKAGPGAARAAAHSVNWSKASLKETISRIAGNNSVITRTAQKTIYTNPKSGLQVVIN